MANEAMGGARRPGGPKIKKHLLLDAEAARRLAVYCAAAGGTESAVVTRLIQVHLRRYTVTDTRGQDILEDRQALAAG